MINTKKSRRSMIALSVLAALILCSFATIYAFAANPDTPEIPTPDLPEVSAIEPGKNVNEDFKFEELYEGLLGIGFQNSDGEEVYRYSPDGGLTWYTDDDILDPDISAIEWLTYDENGYGETAKVIVGNKEEILLFDFSGSNKIVQSYAICDGETEEQFSQEEFDAMMAMYEAMIKEKDLSYNNSHIMTESYSSIDDTYAYRYVSDDGENIMGFGGDTYQSLYEVVKDYFDKWIQEGKMTQEEADRKLAEIKNGAYTVYDAAGNIIK